MLNPQVIVVGPPDRSQPLCTAIGRLIPATLALTVDEALRHPGSLSEASLAVFTGHPGAYPTLEAEAYVESVGALHVSWGATVAEVGPFVAPGYGPCPRCLSEAREPGTTFHQALAAWASSWATLQAEAILQGATDLVGASWTWRLGSPGVEIVSWQRRPGCVREGCRQPWLPRVKSSTLAP